MISDAWRRTRNSVVEDKRKILGKRTSFAKRVVALPGDHVLMRRGTLYVNNREERSLEAAATLTKRGRFDLVKRRSTLTGRARGLESRAHYSLSAMTVPDGHVMVFGDRRDISFDSHIWGPLPIENIVGRVIAIYWPIERVRRFPRDDRDEACISDDNHDGGG